MTRPLAMICISLRYADAPRMYNWLIEAFGFEKHAAYYSDDGKTLLHGELRMGESFVMLGSADNNPFGKLVLRPAELAGTTASPYSQPTISMPAASAPARPVPTSAWNRPTSPMAAATSSARIRRAMSGASAPIGRDRWRGDQAACTRGLARSISQETTARLIRFQASPFRKATL